MTNVARLTILLPEARDRCGRAVLVSGGGEVLLGPFRVLGTASRHVSRRMGNPDHDRLRPFGDPPSGTYAVASSLPPGTLHTRRPGRFGKLGALVLEPTGGEALEAKTHGRARIVLHGGPRDRERRLRRTRGGLRVGNGKLAALLAAINRAQLAGDPLSAVEIVDVARGFDQEPALAPARTRRDRSTRSTPRAVRTSAAVTAAALVMFGVKRASPSRRSFLGAALLAVASPRLLAGCSNDQPDPCDRACQPPPATGATAQPGSGTGSGSASQPGSGTGPAVESGTVFETCFETCELDYGVGGGVG